MQLKRSVYSNLVKDNIISYCRITVQGLMKTADVICSVNVMPSVFDRQVVIIAWKSNLPLLLSSSESRMLKMNNTEL